ncbi:MAG: hypothetical protein KGR69_12370 [Verrucomicrobia bacterium]|nr:hypothetical protein [Verrucomicrobiota bacterium]
MEPTPERDFGLQPLDALLSELGLENHALVAASTEQLTHKQVQKARKGRYVTGNIQRKILAAVNAAAPAGGDGGKLVHTLGQLFNYRP